MADIEIDSSLNVHLGLPESYQLDKMEAFKLYQYFMGMLETKMPIGILMMYYYIDECGGDFINNPKNERDRIVKAIIDNMSKADQFEVMTYASKFPEPFDNEN
jgi:hypothetical protein